MSLLTRTILGVVTGILLVMLFYTRMAKESEKVVGEQQKKDKSAAKAKAGRTADGGTPSATNTTRSGEVETAPTKEPAPGTPNAPNDTTGKDDTTGKAPNPAPSAPDTEAWFRRQIPWMVTGLAIISGIIVIVTGLRGRKWWRKKLSEPSRTDEDPPVLGALLEAYAEEIGRFIVIPRQVKRFASKARLQNEFLRNAFKRRKSAPDFSSTTQEVLGFLLLLVLEKEMASESQPPSHSSSVQPTPPPSAPPKRLHELSEEEFIKRLRSLFDSWHKQKQHEEAYQDFRALLQQREPKLLIPSYESLPADLKKDSGEQLLIELRRLNKNILE